MKIPKVQKAISTISMKLKRIVPIWTKHYSGSYTQNDVAHILHTSFLEIKKQESLILLAFLPFSMKHETGFEPATLALARRYSTTEPLVHFSVFTLSQTQDRLYNIKITLST